MTYRANNGRTRRSARLLPVALAAVLVAAVALYGYAAERPVRRAPLAAPATIEPRPAADVITADRHRRQHRAALPDGAPALGEYIAHALDTGPAALDRRTGEPMIRTWRITKQCEAGSCSLVMSRNVPDFGEESGRLTRAADGWHVTFPTVSFPCFCPGSGERTTYTASGSYVLHFDAADGTAVADDTLVYRSPCNTITTHVRWDAHLRS